MPSSVYKGGSSMFFSFFSLPSLSRGVRGEKVGSSVLVVSWVLAQTVAFVSA